jgi:pimeloyl-ACP methyl ester carboxylesterase
MSRELLVDGVRWSYRDDGKGDVVVLLHGLASDGRTWDRLAPALAARYRTISVELPGYSVLTSGTKAEEPQRLARGVAAFLDRLGVASYSLVGHSFGGTLAMLLARDQPTRCSSLILIAPGGFGTELNPLVALLGTRAGSALLRAAYGRATSRAVRGIASRYTTSGRRGSEVRVSEAMETYERLASQAARSQLRDGVRHARRSKRADGIDGALSLSSDIPILVLWGSEDLVLPPWQANQAQASLPGSQLEFVAGAGHTPHRSHPEQTTSLVTDFLASARVTRRVAALRA